MTVIAILAAFLLGAAVGVRVTFWVCGEMAKKGELYFKDTKGKWIPRDPFKYRLVTVPPEVEEGE